MVQDEHAPFLENIPAYALGTLEAEDVAALEAHLKQCNSCQSELAEYHKVSMSLLTAVQPKQPSPLLRKQLQSQLPSARRKADRQFLWGFNRLVVGIVVIVLVTSNIISLYQIHQIQNQQAELINQMDDAQLALAMLSYPTVEKLPVNGENLTGSFLLDNDRNVAALIVWNIPQLPVDQTYQIWLIDPQGGRIGAGVFRPQNNQAYTTQFIFTEDGFSNFVGIGVTVEPAGGSNQPTGARVLKVDF